MPFFSYLDEYADITDITFYDRKRFAPMDKFSQRVMRGKSDFSVAEKEVFAAYVSGLNECNFCHGTHAAVAKDFGVAPNVIESLLENIEDAPVDDKLKPIFHYLKKLTLTPSKLVQADAENVFQAGWSERSLSDAIAICCLFSFYNRLLDGHGIKGNDNIYQIGSKHLHKNGYGVPWFIGLIKGFIRKSKMAKLSKMSA